jgi:hypothetical protein
LRLGDPGASRRRSLLRQEAAVAKKAVKGPYAARLFTHKKSSANYHSRFKQVSTRIDVRILPHANGGAWIGLLADQLSEVPWTIDRLTKEMKFELIEYVPG